MDWSTENSAALYGLQDWGDGYVAITAEGHLAVCPQGPGEGEVDLSRLARRMEDEGVTLPALVRFPQILRGRVARLTSLFRDTMSQQGYRGGYRPVYPIKVNHRRDVLGTLLESPGSAPMGLEAGSPAELLLALATNPGAGGIVIWHGSKDVRSLELALLADRVGASQVAIVMETEAEAERVVAISERLGIRPCLGVRARLSSAGRGRWGASAGDTSHFGLTPSGLMRVVQRLEKAGMMACLELLHFHVGSQVPEVQTFKGVLRETGRIYSELVRMGAPMGYLDVGGGLGVDYGGVPGSEGGSRDYRDAEYVGDVVGQLKQVFDAAEVAHPQLITESGRAMVAHSTLLLFEVMGREAHEGGVSVQGASGELHPLQADLERLGEGLSLTAAAEVFHGANDVLMQARQAFELGLMSLGTLAALEDAYWGLLGRMRTLAEGECALDAPWAREVCALADTLQGGFSIFQSLPDAWAIGQHFPVLPIERLNERPGRRAVITDLTCDSDGRIDQFAEGASRRRSLPVHGVRFGERYRMAVFLVGAYQEALGNGHNLFGGTNLVSVALDGHGSVALSRVADAETRAQVSARQHHDPETIKAAMLFLANRAREQGRLSPDEAWRWSASVAAAFDASSYPTTEH